MNLQDVDLRDKFDAKKPAYIRLNSMSEIQDIPAARAAMIHQYESLLLADPGIAKPLSFPSCLFDHPAGSEFYHALIRREAGYSRVFTDDFISRFLVDDRVLEEGTRIAQNCRVRQLALPDRNDGIGDICRSGLKDIPFLEDIFDCAVSSIRDGTFLKFHGDGSDDCPAFQLTLENAVTVGELTFRGQHDAHCAARYIEVFKLFQYILHFDAIGSDILDRCCTCLPRDECQVLDTAPALTNGVHHQVVPVLACTNLNPDIILVLANNFLSFDRDLDDQSLEVMGEQDIASTSQEEQCLFSSQLWDSGKLRWFSDLSPSRGLYIDAEAISILEAYILNQVDFRHSAKVGNWGIHREACCTVLSGLPCLRTFGQPMERRQKRKRVIVSVSNDITTDQRVRRSCAVLHDLGYDIILVGRILPGSPPLPDRPYRMKRFALAVSKGSLFYALLNIRLFFFILWRRCDLLYANDLDTLAPNAILSRLKRTPLIYDSHELFTEVPEVLGRPVIQGIWRLIERLFYPAAQGLVTVNGSIANALHQRYGRRPAVVRNIPEAYLPESKPVRTELGLPEDSSILILQGSGINIHRGAEEAVEAMQFLDGCMLLVAGSGDVIPILKKMVDELGIADRVKFLPRQAYSSLMAYTANADLGLSLDKDTSLNYRFSLPNKLFDYIQAGIPVVCSDLPEVAGLVRGFDIGIVTQGPSVEDIVAAVQDALADKPRYKQWKQNTGKAAIELCWERESKHLEEVIRSLNVIRDDGKEGV